MDTSYTCRTYNKLLQGTTSNSQTSEQPKTATYELTEMGKRVAKAISGRSGINIEKNTQNKNYEIFLRVLSRVINFEIAMKRKVCILLKILVNIIYKVELHLHTITGSGVIMM